MSAEYQRGYVAGRRRVEREHAQDRAEVIEIRRLIMAITLYSGITPDQIVDAVLKAAREKVPE